MRDVRSSAALASGVWIQYAVSRRELPAPRRIRRAVAAVFDAVLEGRPGAPLPEDPEVGLLTMRFVGADESQTLNSTYRGRDRATNVLSFPSGARLPAEAGPDGGDARRWPYLGDVVVCIAVVRDEAFAQKKTVVQHSLHMLVHGVLHLLGYDHQDDDEAQDMERIERSILNGLGMPDPYALPAVPASERCR